MNTRKSTGDKKYVNLLVDRSVYQHLKTYAPREGFLMRRALEVAIMMLPKESTGQNNS